MINWFDVPSESPNKDLTLKNLKVTENGTYGESGVAYSSVEVDVNGGGGSSDFSTAEVTLNLTVEGETVVKTALDNSQIAFPSEDFQYLCQYNPTVDNKCKVLLYEGSSEIFGLLALDSNNRDHATIVGEPVVTGDIVWNTETQTFVVSGNGTITATLE